MISRIVFLIGSLLFCTASFAGSGNDRSFKLSEAEAAPDLFAGCFEPELKGDPVIAAPINIKVPFQQLDNSVSNAAFAKCEKELSFDADGPKSKWNRYSGQRLMDQRYIYYFSRGFLSLEERKRMRPFFLCAEQAIGDAVLPTTSLEAKALHSAVVENCKEQLIQYDSSDKGVEWLNLINQYARGYQVKFVAEAIDLAAGIQGPGGEYASNK